jgi:hypothetical protein
LLPRSPQRSTSQFTFTRQKKYTNFQREMLVSWSPTLPVKKKVHWLFIFVTIHWLQKESGIKSWDYEQTEQFV